MCKYYYIVVPILDKVLGDVVFLSDEEATLLKDYIEPYPQYAEVKERAERNGNIK